MKKYNKMFQRITLLLAAGVFITSCEDFTNGVPEKDPTLPVDASLDQIENREALRPLLAVLPERERTVLLLRFFESLTQTQIAERVGISQMHVSRLLAKSLARLRDQLQ